MKDKGSDLKKKLLESLPDEMDDELFRQLQSEISKTVNEYDDSGSDRVHENEDSNIINDNDSAGVTAGAGSKEPDGIFDDPDGSEFSYDRIMSEMADVEMPPELEKRLRRINEDYIAACEAKAELENRKQKRARSMKRIRSAAAVIAVFAVISGGVIWKAPQAEAFRLKLYDTANEIIERDGFILYPSVLPDGYEVKEIKSGNRNKFVFKNLNNNYQINLLYYKDSSVVHYNDSDKSKNSEILINGQTAILRDNNEKKEIYWSYDGLYIQLTLSNTEISINSATNIAENIKKYKKIL